MTFDDNNSLQKYSSALRKGTTFLSPHLTSTPVRTASSFKDIPVNTTLSRQTELKRFPVPDLDATLNTFSASVPQFLTDPERNELRKLIDDFRSGQGQKLQSALAEKALNSDNWLADWWNDVAYLTYRDPVMVWVSPGLALPKREFADDFDYLDYAARLVAGFVDFNEVLKQQRFPVETMGKEPMDMDQYYLLLGTTRIPGANRDSVRVTPNSRHIVVIHNNRYFRLNVYDEKGRPSSEDQIMGALRYITEVLPKEKPREFGGKAEEIGALSAVHRDEWARSHAALKVKNGATIDDIETSLFTLSLDGELSESNKNVDGFSKTVAHSIHAHGVKTGAAGNRWFDKILQVFVTRSGESGLTYEHSTAEAVAVIAILNHVMRCVDGGTKFDEGPRAETAQVPRHLPFAVDDPGMIRSAVDQVEKLAGDVDALGLHFTAFGKGFVKKQRFSPDSWVQMAIQLAFYRLHGVPGAHYESGGLRVFKKGRTDIIRSCSPASIEFARSILDEASNVNAKMEAMKRAIMAHSAYAKATVQGQGCDRHLLGLRLIAAEMGDSPHPFFSHPAYARSVHHRISSSQVSGEFEGSVSFGPLVPDGYGCCYNIREGDFLFGLSSMRSCGETNTVAFKRALNDSLVDMHDVAVAANSKL